MLAAARTSGSCGASSMARSAAAIDSARSAFGDVEMGVNHTLWIRYVERFARALE